MYQAIYKSDKITMCREIHEVLAFLGIPSEKFSELKQQHGGLIPFHKWCEAQIGGESNLNYLVWKKDN